MTPTSFFPGPSKADPNLKTYLEDAYNQGILSLQHRSATFIDLVRETLKLLHEKLEIPSNYTVSFAGSATECWEILGESFIDQFSLHLTTGAFGEKWSKYRSKLAPNCVQLALSPQKILSLNQAAKFKGAADIICLTQNETSNGTQVKNKLIHKFKKRFEESLIFVDSTSYMAGQFIDWRVGDVFFASVQKCFGLPPGLAVLVCSPRAIQKARALNHSKHYNSLTLLTDYIEKYQTSFTPNILGIYLLKRILEARPDIRKLDRQLKMRAKLLRQACIKMGYKPFIINSAVRSDTVLVFRDKPDFIELLKTKTLAENMILGNGYGLLKPHTFRIANFPAHTDADFERLLKVLKQCKEATTT